MRAITYYEFRMQLRRPAFWIVLAVGVAFTAYRTFLLGGDKPAAASGALDWPMMLRGAAQRSVWENFLLPVVAGVLLADRWPRDRRLGMAELLASAPAAAHRRLWGKLLGAGGATALAVFAYCSAVTAYFAVDTGQWGVAAAGMLAFLALTLPALLLVGALSTAVPTVLPMPVHLFLLTGYWFWGNAVDPASVPTLSCTWLSPVGGNVSAGLFHGTALYAGTCDRPPHDPTTTDALASLAVTVLVALLAMLAGQLRTARRRASA